MTWRGYQAPKYVALEEIRTARKLAAKNGKAAEETVRGAASRALNSWTVQREAAACFVAHNDLETALDYLANIIELWPGDPRGLLLEACAVAIAVGQH